MTHISRFSAVSVFRSALLRKQAVFTMKLLYVLAVVFLVIATTMAQLSIDGDAVSIGSLAPTLRSSNTANASECADVNPIGGSIT